MTPLFDIEQISDTLKDPLELLLDKEKIKKYCVIDGFDYDSYYGKIEIILKDEVNNTQFKISRTPNSLEWLKILWCGALIGRECLVEIDDNTALIKEIY